MLCQIEILLGKANTLLKEVLADLFAIFLGYDHGDGRVEASEGGNRV